MSDGGIGAAPGTEGDLPMSPGTAGNLGLSVSGSDVGVTPGPSGPGAGQGPIAAGGTSVIPKVEAAAVLPKPPETNVEQKTAIKRKARRRSLLTGEEGGLTDTPIYRRSILGR